MNRIDATFDKLRVAGRTALIPYVTVGDPSLATMPALLEAILSRYGYDLRNYARGSLERRVLVSARKFPEHGIGTDKQIVELAPVDKSTQPPQTIELPTRSADAA